MATFYDARRGGDDFLPFEMGQFEGVGLGVGLDLDLDLEMDCATMGQDMPLGEWDASWPDLDLASFQGAVAPQSLAFAAPTADLLDGGIGDLVGYNWLAGDVTGLAGLDDFEMPALGFDAGDVLGLGATYPAVDGLSFLDVDLLHASSPSTASMPATPESYAFPTVAVLSSTAFPSSTSTPASLSSAAHRCPSCADSFPTAYQLSKHQRQHVKPERCPVCHVGKAALRDLHRHMWTDHKEYAEQAGTPSEVRTCPVEGCGYTGRKDNIARHCKKKHGKALRWRRGEPSLV